MDILIIIFQVVLAVLVSPLLSGFIKKVKNIIRMRRGAPVFQPYYNLAKYMSKDEVVSETSSWIFQLTPFVVSGAVICALFLVPLFGTKISLFPMGDVLALFFIMGLARFFLALSALDTGSAFGGMGSSREMFISGLAEPVAISAVAVAGLQGGSLDLGRIGFCAFTSFSSLIAVSALFFVILAETSRVPVDNQETHLELTMIHEAMILEYSGPSLGLLELAAHIKQFLFYSLAALLFFPVSFGWYEAPVLAIFLFVAKIIFMALFVSFMEIALAKMRLFRVVDFMGFGLALSILSLVVRGLGY
ncbi:MAG TPA: NADH-quinone oxidoreductase subunit H [Candidatus Omnitrophota bacterium]|nr:NADH-quinone oxidoreductase subunit H [Candidatus Omnitrophota bacterium]